MTKKNLPKYVQDPETLNQLLGVKHEILIQEFNEQSESIFKENLTNATKQYFEQLNDFHKRDRFLVNDYLLYCKNTYRPSINLDFLVETNTETGITDIKNGDEYKVVLSGLRDIRTHFEKYNQIGKSSVEAKSNWWLTVLKLIDSFVQFVLSLFKQSRQDKFEEEIKIKTSELVDEISRKKPRLG